MAETVVAANNKAVVYGTRPQRERPRVPPVSKAENAAMHAAAEGNSTLGIPASVGKEFTADQDLPQRVGPKRKTIDRMKKRGAISDRAAAKHLGRYGGKDQDESIDASTR